jgi:hypothetical protein
LALSLVSLCAGRGCDYQVGNDHSLAPHRLSSVLALAIAQPVWSKYWSEAAISSIEKLVYVDHCSSSSAETRPIAQAKVSVTGS